MTSIQKQGTTIPAIFFSFQAKILMKFGVFSDCSKGKTYFNWI